MSEITITAMGAGEYGVQVREGDVETGHKVTVPGSLLDDLGVSEDKEEEVVRESFAFLLDREKATSILREFALTSISDFFPEYGDEMRRRLA